LVRGSGKYRFVFKQTAFVDRMINRNYELLFRVNESDWRHKFEMDGPIHSNIERKVGVENRRVRKCKRLIGMIGSESSPMIIRVSVIGEV
jgi:hypothetical protein